MVVAWGGDCNKKLLLLLLLLLLYIYIYNICAWIVKGHVGDNTCILVFHLVKNYYKYLDYTISIEANVFVICSH